MLGLAEDGVYPNTPTTSEERAKRSVTETPEETMEIIPNINTQPPAEPPNTQTSLYVPQDTSPIKQAQQVLDKWAANENKKTIKPIYYNPSLKGAAAVKQAQANANMINTQMVAAERAALAGIDMTSNWPADWKTNYDRKMATKKNKVPVKNSLDYRVIQQQQEMIKQGVPTMSLVPTSVIDADTAYYMPREYDKTINGNAANKATVDSAAASGGWTNGQKLGVAVLVIAVGVGVWWFYKSATVTYSTITSK